MRFKTIFVVPGQEPEGAQRCSPPFAAEAARAYADMDRISKLEDLGDFAGAAGVPLEAAEATRELWRADVATFGPTRERTRCVRIKLES
jgi:hypothetical protein